MRIKGVIGPLAALLLAATLSCTQRERVGGCGSVALTFSTGLDTKASTPGDGTVADGGGIFIAGNAPDVVVYLFNSSGGRVGIYPTDGDDAECILSTSTSATIEFLEIPEGTYSVYAVANTQGLWAMDGFTSWASISTESALNDLVFTPLASGIVPVVTDRLPLSAKGTVSVSADQRGEVSLELLRCTGKVSVELLNQTNETLEFSNLSITLKNMCASTGYLFAHTPDKPGASTTSDIAILSGASCSVESATSRRDSVYVFPQIVSSPARFLCDVSFTLDDVDESFTDLPVQNYRAEDIISIARNEHLKITIRIGRGKMVSFNFAVGEWEELFEDVSFD